MFIEVKSGTSLWLVVLISVSSSYVSFKLPPLQKCTPYQRLYLTMDDEVARDGIKIELTTLCDDFFGSSALRLSGSGHLLSPPNEESVHHMLTHPISSTLLDKCQNNEPYLGFNMRGLYVHKIGGLPLFSSGNRIDSLCTREYSVCSQACDVENIIINDVNNEIKCARTSLTVGYTNITSSLERHLHFHTNQLYFLPVDHPWPIECQPENVWGSEGQYRAWNGHELASRPLSY